MVTQQVQIKINLPLALKEFLDSKAAKFDIPLAVYVKHLVLQDVKDLDYPTFQISEQSEKKAQEALKERKKAAKVKNLAKFFDEL